MNYSLTEFVFLWLLPIMACLGLLYLIVKYHEENPDLVLTPVPVVADMSRELELVSLGECYFHNGKLYNLRDYFVDRNHNLYSRNGSSWEIKPNKGKDILICSDSAFSRSGVMVNSLRTIRGDKVTIARNRLDFNKLSILNNTVKLRVTNTTERHLKVTKVGV